MYKYFDSTLNNCFNVRLNCSFFCKFVLLEQHRLLG